MSLSSTVKSVAKATQYILEDPALGKVAVRIIELNNLEQPDAGKGPATGPRIPGIGLNRLVKPLDVYISFRKNPVPFYIGAAAVAGGLVFLGYLLG